jgi:hypothetical protein
MPSNDNDPHRAALQRYANRLRRMANACQEGEDKAALTMAAAVLQDLALEHPSNRDGAS